jgi:hypothetical protein
MKNILLLIATVMLFAGLVLAEDPKPEAARPAAKKMPAKVNAEHKRLRDLADRKRLEIEKTAAEHRAAQSEAREIDRALQDVFKEGLKQLGITDEQLSDYDVTLDKDEIVLTPKKPPAAPAPKKQ